MAKYKWQNCLWKIKDRLNKRFEIAMAHIKGTKSNYN